ncbi:MAG: hypothetical protein VW556_07250 [Gammaproteobacteria bacterium]
MSITQDVVRETLEYSDNLAFKNQCVMVLDSYLEKEPELTRVQLVEALKIYVNGLDYD